MDVESISSYIYSEVLRWGNNGNHEGLYLFFLGSKITADGDCAMKLKDACSLGEKL